MMHQQKATFCAFVLFLGSVLSEELDWKTTILLMRQCRHGNRTSVQEYMDSFGVSTVLEAKDDMSYMCVHHAAAWNRDPDVLWFLHEKGQNPNIVNSYKDQPLTKASSSPFDRLAHVKILLDYGADPKAKHSQALRRCKDGKVARVLLQSGADPDATNDDGKWDTPFKRAVRRVRLDVVREMAKWKETVEEVSAEDVSGWSLQHIDLRDVREAIRMGREDRRRVLAINECLSNPCHNGGTCIDKFDAFECQCSSGGSGGPTGPTCWEKNGKCGPDACPEGEVCVQLTWRHYGCSDGTRK